ncbi:hypothetical protein [Paenibacillus puldeungensis]|uniref:hypothetical protein n=1 Tax=Paenibacillus puldeungensis TaxID=696536 RepID=UPI0036D37F28
MIGLSVCFYDNSEIINEPKIRIDRVYCLDFSNFSEETWDKLAVIYSKLPMQIINNNVQAWFGEEGKSEYYLYASVEPSGLQIVGVLSSDDWFTWEAIFNEEIKDLPSFEC